MATGRAIIVVAVVDGSYLFVSVIHDAVWVGAVGQTEIVAEFMQDDCPQPVVISGRIGRVQAEIADDRGSSRAIAEPEDAPDGIFISRLFYFTIFISYGCIDVIPGDAEDYG